MWLGLSGDVSLWLFYTLIFGWFLFVVIRLRRRIARRISDGAGNWSLRGAGMVCAAFTLVMIDRFLLVRVSLDFHLEEVILAALTMASLVVAWARAGWVLPATFAGGWTALLLGAKPLLWPLASEYGAGAHVYPLFAETNLYFFLSAAGLLLAAAVPGLRWLARRV